MLSFSDLLDISDNLSNIKIISLSNILLISSCSFSCFSSYFVCGSDEESFGFSIPPIIFSVLCVRSFGISKTPLNIEKFK